jgi:hypothetical protein
MQRVRVILLALLVLVVPTFALGGEEEPSGPGALSVSAALEGCGLANAAIVCQINATWSSVDGADYYAVSVTRPDGSVADLGQGAGTSRTLFVPYVGAGTYSVQVAAWGTPPGEDEPQVLARDEAEPTDGADRQDVEATADAPADAPQGDGRDAVAPAVDAVDEPPPPVEPPIVDPGCELPEDDEAGDDGEVEEPTAVDQSQAAPEPTGGVAEGGDGELEPEPGAEPDCP